MVWAELAPTEVRGATVAPVVRAVLVRTGFAVPTMVAPMVATTLGPAIISPLLPISPRVSAVGEVMAATVVPGAMAAMVATADLAAMAGEPTAAVCTSPLGRWRFQMTLSAAIPPSMVPGAPEA